MIFSTIITIIQLEYFHHPKKEPLVHLQSIPIPPLARATTNLLSVSVELPFLDHMVCGLLHLASSTEHVFEVYPFCSTYQLYICF